MTILYDFTPLFVRRGLSLLFIFVTYAYLMIAEAAATCSSCEERANILYLHSFV